MSNRSTPSAAALAALTALAVAAVPATARAGVRSSIVAECANPSLPAEILGTPPAGAMAGLSVVAVTGSRAPLRLAVASDPPTRELGLMCVTALRPHHGMIFVFPDTVEQPFWMKDTLISLDMVWLNADGTVATVARNVPASTRSTPDSLVARRSGRGRYVIELRAGEAEADAIVPGTRLVVPPLRATR